jgi:hypothetical protein
MSGRMWIRTDRRAIALGTMALCAGFAIAIFAASACSNSNPAGAGIGTDAGGVASNPSSAAITNDAGQSVKAFAAPGDPGASAVYITISGESNAIGGYPFPPGDWTNDTYMFDGWQFLIQKYIVNVDHVTLWANPDESPTDQSKHGTAVAHVDGPFVVDLHKGGNIVGQGGAPEQATPIAVILNQNDNGNAAFSPTDKYGFGFSTVAASYSGYNVNLGADEVSDFDYMVQHGYSVLYIGTAQWMGDKSPYGCTQTNAGAGADSGLLFLDGGDDGGGAGVPTYVDGGYDFTKMPPSMTFRLGFSTPTNYVNCENMTLQGTPNPGEDYPRGIQISTSQSTIAQVTVHMDHPFWESFAEDTPVHWDQIAAQYVGASGVPEAHVEDMKGVPFYAFTDKTGTPLPWRNCSGQYYTPPGNGQMFFNPLSVPVDPGETDPSKAIRDYYDFIRYTQSTQGHLNSQGLCYIDRQYPCPPGGS